MTKFFRFKNLKNYKEHDFPGISLTMLDLVKKQKNTPVEMTLDLRFTNADHIIWFWKQYYWNEKWLTSSCENGQYELDF